MIKNITGNRYIHCDLCGVVIKHYIPGHGAHKSIDQCDPCLEITSKYDAIKAVHQKLKVIKEASEGRVVVTKPAMCR